MHFSLAEADAHPLGAECSQGGAEGQGGLYIHDARALGLQADRESLPGIPNLDFTLSVQGNRAGAMAEGDDTPRVHELRVRNRNLANETRSNRDGDRGGS